MYLFDLQFCLDICPGMGLLDHMVIIFLVFWGTSILFSTVAALTYLLTNSVEGSLFPTPSLAFVICRLFNDGHSDWCEVVPHCSFDLHFSIISDVERLLMCLLHRRSFLNAFTYGSFHACSTVIMGLDVMSFDGLI